MVTLPGIRGVVFDLDDTLYPESAYVRSGFAAVGAWLQSRMTCPSDPASRLNELFASGQRGRLFDLLLKEWGCAGAAEMVPQMVECYRQHEPSLALHPDAERAIARWKAHFRLGLITDGPLVAQRRKIAMLQLDTVFDPIMCTDAWGRKYWKPHVRAFQEIQQAWRFPGRSCVYIGDNPAKDFIAPNSLGWYSVRVTRAGCEYGQTSVAPEGEPGYCVTTLDEVELTLRA